MSLNKKQLSDDEIIEIMKQNLTDWNTKEDIVKFVRLVMDKSNL
jgi:glutamate mutase epsilon subunit